jgi:uridine nucleosidase
MTVQTSELAAEAYARWNGNGKPIALWLDCDTGHDV